MMFFLKSTELVKEWHTFCFSYIISLDFTYDVFPQINWIG